ncbi:hypothetical protein [Longimicrobium sp.]|jgi:uncharacterized protein (DUF433 family)|uniref:hypothetical protein n=1 Tax=Longimicrobium sp. TaxID=2029185 RepID=UPI002F958475
MIGTGLYTPQDAAMLLHEQPRTIRRWAFGYGRNRAAGRVPYPPLIETDLSPLEGQDALTFLELIELLYIRAFLRAGVSWKTVKTAANVAARMFDSKHPFALRRLYVDPKAVFAGVQERDGRETLIQLVGHGQHTMPSIVKPYLDELEFDVNDVANRWWPMGRLAGVVIDPRFSFGAPIVEDVGIRTRTLIETYDDELPRYKERTVDHVAWTYTIKAIHVESALRFRTWLMNPIAN